MPKRTAPLTPVTPPRRSKRQRPVTKTTPGTVPYVSGFRRPSDPQSRRAIGSPPLPAEYSPTALYRPLPEPTSDLDWLAHVREHGQTYDQFTATSYWCAAESNAVKGRAGIEFRPGGSSLTERYKGGKIYLLPLGDFTSLDTDLLAEYTRLYYGTPTDLLPRVPTDLRDGEVLATLPGGPLPLTTRYHEPSGHYQLRVDSGFTELAGRLTPPDCLFLVIITLADLYSDPSDLFIAGVGSLKDKLGVFSFRRYDPNLTFSASLWHDTRHVTAASPGDRSRVLLQRSSKLLVHEIGHILGLGHCVYFSCVMNGSGHLAEDYRQPHHLCPVDLRKVMLLHGGAAVDRYRSLEGFYERVGMAGEREWVSQRVKEITDKLTAPAGTDSDDDGK